MTYYNVIIRKNKNYKLKKFYENVNLKNFYEIKIKI